MEGEVDEKIAACSRFKFPLIENKAILNLKQKRLCTYTYVHTHT